MNVGDHLEGLHVVQVRGELTVAGRRMAEAEMGRTGGFERYLEDKI